MKNIFSYILICFFFLFSLIYLVALFRISGLIFNFGLWQLSSKGLAGTVIGYFIFLITSSLSLVLLLKEHPKAGLVASASLFFYLMFFLLNLFMGGIDLVKIINLVLFAVLTCMASYLYKTKLTLKR